MTKKIFRSICMAAMIVFLISLALIMGALYGYFSNIQMRQLHIQADMAARGVEEGGIRYLEELDEGDCRITWIDPDGRVLFDNRAGSLEIENHLEREEIADAIIRGKGESKRYSTTLLERQLYVAVRLCDETVLRLSSSQQTWWSLALEMLQPIALVVLAAVGISFFLAFRLSEWIIRPLNDLNLDEPERTEAYEEIMPLLHRIGSQQERLRLQEEEVERRKNEFESATKNMREGLLLLNEHGTVLSLNDSASGILGITQYCVGKDFLLFYNSEDIQEQLRAAQGGKHTEMIVCLDGSNYQINASPVIFEGRVSGIVLLIFDISEKEKAEQMRREFTANVSHELKTPLQSISGYAELLCEGMVKSQDVPRFCGQILSEARRMVTLVEDIIRLSRLDEGAEGMPKETVDLYELAALTVRNIAPAARDAGVSIHLEGKSVKVTGVPVLLETIFFNLCDNAVKYNRTGGSVTVHVGGCKKEGRECAIVSVSDTGIGIPDSDQDRIFERFYRVDKSRSKAVGGTGLGLSIVKHAARVHDAQVRIESEVGRGTTFTVSFPLKKQIAD